MLKRINLTNLFSAVQDRIQAGTGFPCYDAVPDNAAGPFYYMVLAGHSPADTKTMYVQRYSIDIHVIADVSPSSVPAFRYIKALEEALTDDIQVPSPYHLVRQDETGIRNVYNEVTGEKHAVVGFDFLISYGFKVKI